MARSKRKTPIFGNSCAASEKQDKRFANRALRRIGKQQIQKCLDFEGLAPTLIKEVSSTWVFAKDGKHYWFPELDSQKYEYFLKLMRK